MMVHHMCLVHCCCTLHLPYQQHLGFAIKCIAVISRTRLASICLAETATAQCFGTLHHESKSPVQYKTSCRSRSHPAPSHKDRPPKQGQLMMMKHMPNHIIQATHKLDGQHTSVAIVGSSIGVGLYRRCICPSCVTSTVPTPTGSISSVLCWCSVPSTTLAITGTSLHAAQALVHVHGLHSALPPLSGMQHVSTQPF